jgi:DNA-binding PadR family transcriptional regulator
MSKRKLSNPLALAVLAHLEERPMHPYEMATLMRERGKEHSIKLNYGSLYTVVESLQRAGFITAQETVREGRRPERTVYEITDSGRAELYDWLCELLGEPAKEYPRFMAGLSLIGVLPPAKGIAVLEQRERRLTELVERTRADLTRWAVGTNGTPPIPRVFLIEGEYELAMREAELNWLRGLLRDIKGGTLGGIEMWEHFHQLKASQTSEPPGVPDNAPGEEGAARSPAP